MSTSANPTTRRGLLAGLVALSSTMCACQGFLDTLAADTERKRTVTVIVEGAVIGPADQDGAAWDGPGLSPEMIQTFSTLAIQELPVGRVPVVGDILAGFAGELATSIFASFEAPDPEGSVRIDWAGTDGLPASSRELPLPTNQESYTPRWAGLFTGIPIHQAIVTVDLWDADLMDDDPIGTLQLGPEQLLQAEAAGGTYAFDATEASSGMITRLFVTVRP